MKKICALLLCFLLLPLFPALGEGTQAEDAAAETEAPAKESLVVGNPTPMRGQFFTELWGNSTSDADVRDLLHAYNLIHWDTELGMFTVDPSVVSGMVVTADAQGNHTYVMVLYNDMFYSDGSPITAWDYAFSYLLTIAPEIAEIGGSPMRREQIAGYQAYIENGEPLSGVRVLSDDTLSVTLDHNYLPFFYEMGLLSCNPYPISVIAPGVEVRDDGMGVYLHNIDDTVEEPLFTPELLAQTILDPETGYQSHPSVVSGPYTILSWDGTTAEFELNPIYKGNSRGERPSIRRLTYTLADIDTMIGDLAEGRFDLLNKVMRADTILDGMNRMGEAGLAFSNYPRLGLSYISFSCERPALSSVKVRQAIASCFDRDAAVADYTSAFGMRVDGYFGIGQWMYGLITGTIPPPVAVPEDANDAAAMAKYDADLAAYGELNLDGLDPYGLDIEKAEALLEEDGWRLNAEGLREKDGTVLDLRLIYPEGNSIEGTFAECFQANLEKVGIRLTMEAVPMAELLSRWYQQEAREDDLIYLASNFNIVFDPSVNFAPDGSWTYTNLYDEALYNAAVDMRTTEPGDVLTYMRHWVEFQERFNTVLPMIPVYSNVYFDFYREDLQNYNIAENVTWGQAIVGAYFGQAEEEAPEETDMDTGDGEVVFFE